jgi:cobalt-zinc-cadmium efflux system outer membrane protein
VYIARARREQHSEALAQRVLQLERELSAQFEARWLLLIEQQQALIALRSASATQRIAAEKSLIAYSMGEHSMTELIHNRRLANERQLAAQRLLIEVAHNRAQIELDAHRLWDLDD